MARPERRAAAEDADDADGDSMLSGLSRFMQALAGEAPSRPKPNLSHDTEADWGDDDEDLEDPDLVSLDDLLDEEESRSFDPRRDWGLGEDDYDTIN